MKNLDELKKQYEKLGQEIERFESGVEWVPEDWEEVFVIQGNGEIEGWFFSHVREFLDNYNIYKKEAQAQKAARLMKRSNAIIRACLLVDPEFEPRWSATEFTCEKWSVFYDYDIDSWETVSMESKHHHVPYVSTKEKAQQVCDLLTKWGIK